MLIFRIAIWLLRAVFYRLHVKHGARLPVDGGALLVANHTSIIDAYIVQLAAKRRIHFVLSEDVRDTPLVRRLARMLRIVPVETIGDGIGPEAAFREAGRLLSEGEAVCIIGAGRLTRGGKELSMDECLAGVLKEHAAPVIPVHLDRINGPLYHFHEGRYRWRWPEEQIPFPITVAFGEPLEQPSAARVRQAILDLGNEAYVDRPLKNSLLHRRFIRTARKHPFSMAMADGRIPNMTYIQALAGSIAFARKLRGLLDDRPMTGLLLPPSVGGALANVALTMLGKVSVNLNYTSSNSIIAGCATKCDIKHVLTAKAFLDKVPLDVPGEAIYLEDVRASVTKKDRIVALLMGLFLPIPVLERMLGAPSNRSPDDLATIIFSSGSTAEPKGVMLSHYNIAKNIEGTCHVLPFRKDDGIMAVLPLFHSFGYTDTLWLPLNRAIRVIYHANPLEARIIGEFIHKHKPKFFVSTPTFLQNYIRKCLPEELASLVYVITGAEKLPARIREAFKSKFGPEPLEGYGTTECAPVVSANLPDIYTPGFYLAQTRHGSIGRSIPGVSLRVRDPDTDAELPEGEPGLLCVKGPNVMQGYLQMEDQTREVLRDGWYNTGDVAKLDADGFITITDRLSRFSKIGGEMVPHHKIEDALHHLLNVTDQRLAVVGVPDVNKGERLVVLHTLEDNELEKLMGRLDKSDLPNLYVPRAKSFYRVDELPILGTGKIDLKQLKQRAQELDVGT